MPGRSLKASSARPSQTQAEGRADDASSLTSNTVAHFGGVFRGQASNYRERLRFRSAGGAFWLSEFLHEMTTFPGAKYDDQVDSTTQALAWINTQPPEPGIIEFYRRECAFWMHREGKSIESIAAELDSTPEEIKIWLKEHEEFENWESGFDDDDEEF